MNAVKYISYGLVAGAAIGSVYAFMKNTTPASRKKMKKHYNTASHAVSEMIGDMRSTMR